MSIIFTSLLLWIVFCSRIVEGQSECQRTNRQPSWMCVAQCDPSTGCSETEEECLCDGDCGYSCVKKDLSCGRPPNVRNAEAQYPSTKFGETVTYVCNKGYTLSGASQRTCRANENWDGVGPNCLRMCTLPTIPFSTYIKKPDNFNRTYMTGERITLACKKGFKKQPGGNPVRICINGLWTRFPFKCEGTHSCKRTIRAARTKCTQECSPESGCGSGRYRCLCDGSCGFSCVEKGMSCGNPPPVQNGKLNFTRTSYNSTAHYSCNEGYDLNTNPIKRCTAKKRWDGLTPRCLQDCPEPTIPRNANISNPSKKYRAGYKVTFKCNKGYNQEGMATQMCFLGRWTVMPFKCTEGGCGDPGTPESGRKLGVTYSVNSMVYFNCDLGYELVGSLERKCQLNGTWTGTQPVCKVSPVRNPTYVNCGFPPRPKNGSFVGDKTTFQSSLQFRCDDGFDLQGSETRMCTSDKNWSGKEVSCIPVDCGRLPTPLNGSLSGEETTYPNHVKINCDQGFILSGSHKRTCQADGRWDGNKTSCKAVDCGALTSPTNGSSFGTATTFSKIIKFSCDAGFDLVGSSSRMCMANKTWSGEMPVCKAVDCGMLAAPMNGTLLSKDTTYLNEVEINCDEGFILRGSRRRKCQADRSWSGDTTVCEAVNCGKPALPDHGSVSGFSTRYPHPITFTCDTGYEIQGSVVRRCQADGIWSGNKTSCKPVDCGPLQAPNNGTKTGDKTTFLKEVIFYCDDGHDLMGSSSRVCQANKQWSGDETSCTAKDCGQLAIPTNGSVTGQRTTYPNEVTFQCDDGFNIFGSKIRKCLSNGIWSGNKSYCSAKDCGSIKIPLNGTKRGNHTTYPNKVSFACEDGFNLKGSNVRECKSDGAWSGEETFCEAKDCGYLQLPVNGSLVGLYLTTFPNSLTFACDLGFNLKGSQVRHCEANAVWSGNETFCQAKDCGPLHAPANGSMVGDLTTYPHDVSFACDEGFLLRGSKVRGCTSEGTWNGTLAFCEAKDCGSLAVPTNGSAIGLETSYPNEIAFHCDDGFNMAGSRIRKCLSSGLWSGNETSCTAVDCGYVPTPHNGTKFGEDTTYPNSIEFSCDEGFVILGSTVRSCLTNGTWSGQQTRCKAVDCGRLSAPLNGSLQGSATTFPNVLEFSCDVGFILGGSAVRKCQANATWSGKASICKARDCGYLPAPMNGTVLGDQTTYPNELSFSCDEGFELVGSSVRQCRADGNWNRQQPTCNATDCGPLQKPWNGSSSGDLTVFPNSIQFSCDRGFFLTGSSRRECQANGTWSGHEIACNPVDCGKVQTPRNGSLLGNYTTFPNKLRFHCDDGFLLRGSTVRSCTANKTWSGQETTCEAKDCGPLLTPKNGSISGGQTTFPNEVNFSCNEGFIMKGPEKRRCQADGTWSGNVTSCEAVNCGLLAIPKNGSLSGNLTVFPNSIQFKCGPGFILSGSSIRKCQASGTWSGLKTLCSAIDCGKLQAPQNGSVFGRNTTYPHMLRFTCNVGFSLLGSSDRMCQANGTWSGTNAFCQANDCGTLPVPLNGTLSGNLTTYPNKVIFQCDEGFTLRGSAERRCQPTKQWSGNRTFCEAKDCGPLRVPVNGSAIGNLSTFPTRVLFQCDEGFILKGSETRQCQANGLWSGNETSCKAVDCGRLQSPLNGSLSGSLTVYPNIVRLWCDPGFVIHGSSTRTCQSNGTWDGFETFCEAIDCGKPLVPRNGTMFGKETIYPNSLRFSCDKGFILSGSWLRKCQTNGTWSGNETKCRAQDCGPLAVPTNGSSDGDLTVFPNKKVFGCDEGFFLRGSNVRNCQANGTWSGNQTFCEAVDCGPLPAPINGSLSGNSTVFPNSGLFNCDPGFILNGSTIRTCQPNGTWSGFLTACSAVDCGRPQPIQNGSVIGKETVYPNFAKYSCDDGYVLRGPSKVKCQANGTWTKTISFCEAKDCGALPVPMNGSTSGRKTNFPNTVTFSCHEGFLLNGSTVRRCQADGSWSGTETSCEAVDCGPLTAPTNGSFFGNKTVFPNSMLFNCNPGFVLSGSSKRRCQPNGTWSGVATMCTANDCGPLAVPTNGSSEGKLTTFPNKIFFNCDGGFHLRGSHIRLCRENGTWSGTETFCQAVDCGLLSAPMNGTSSGEATVFPNNVLFKCDPGFILNGSNIRTCQPNGTWSGFPTVCSAVDCGPLSVPMNGSSSGNITVFPNSVQFNCDPGFILHGSVMRTCQSNGTWSGFRTLCSAIDCGEPKPLQNGSIIGEKIEYPNVVYHRCDEGFVLQGPSKIKCQTNGTWSTTQSFCEAKDCGTLAAPVNGSVDGCETTFPNEAIFSCDEGFILNGSTVRRCQSDGTWSGIRASCRAVDCGPLSVPINGSSFGASTVFPNTVLFKCDPGFNLNGSSTRRCQANGTWGDLAVICVAKDCGPLAVPTNGSSTGDLTVFPNRILFSCDEGFLLRGSDIRHCQANGGWSGNQTFCEAVDCGPLPVPINGSSFGDSTVYPNNVLFNCDHGFILSGSTMRTCQPNGTWSGLPSLCSAVECGPLSVPMNGSSFGNSTVFPNSVVFSCDPGFTLNGSKTRTCWGNGTWSGTQAMCSAVDCGQPHPLKNGTIIGENTVYPNFVTHQCDEGFILRGSLKIKCQANGTWSRTSSFCEAKDCGMLSVPLNGSLTGIETTFPNAVTFSCDEGFILNGSSIRRCLSDGSWSGIQTSCEAVDCGPLYAPMNGSAFGDSTVFPNSVLFKCDPGFVLTGSSKRTCQPNGTWNGFNTMCVARDCGPLTVPTNGSSTGDLTVFPNKIDFNCDEGFILRGSRSRQCQANGTWSGNQTYCEAVDCGSLSVPMNGSSSGDSTVFPNSVHFTCDPGFILNGSSMRTCQPDGTWNGRTTICVAVDCGTLSVPKNGSSSGDSTVFPNNVRFKCDPGFILNGSTIRTCQPDGTWSGFPTICSAVDCGRPQPLQNGSIVGDKIVYPNYANHACDEGFILRGSPKIKCQTNGTWSRTASFCEAKDCGPLTAPLNGSIAGRETTFPSKVTLSCDEGFLLNGSNIRRCQANGNWSGTENSCKAVDCGPLPIPPNGTLFGELTVFPNEVKFSCDPGYILSGSYSRKCRANGTWSGMETICTPVDCGPLQPLQNGSLIGESTVFPDVVNAACDPGFILRGSSRIDCQVNGSWSSTDTFCEAKDCGNLSTPLNGSVIGYETTYPNELEFKCDVGFELRGSARRRCEADGKWGGVEANCQAVDCGPLNVPENGVAHGNSTTYPNVMSISCKTGFSLQGTATRKCQADGTWTNGKVVCLGQDCNLLRPPHNGWIFGSKTTHPHSVIFSCASGFTIDGSSERTCLRNGSWSGQQPKCLPNWCSKAPDVPPFAYQTWKASKTRYQSGQSIYYSCKAGFIMVGIPVRQCNMGQWSELRFNCSAPSCDAPKVPKYSYVTSARGSQSKYLHGEKVYYSCQAGYKLLGIPQIECTDGVWTKNSFTCEAVNCGSLTSPSNGWIQKKTGETFGALHLFMCNVAEGYLMRGSKERRCLANATWSGVQPVCYLQTCDAPRKPVYGKLASKPNNKYFFGDVVEYQCNNGFSPRGHETTRCQIHGNWSNPAPICLSCSSPLGLKNRMIFSHQLSASSERDSRHGAKHGRLHGNSAWCSARSSFPKYFQIDFGRTMQVTAVATQGHPREQKWVLKYVLKYLLGKNWLTYQESGQDKVFRGNRDGNTVMKHYLKEKLVAKTLRILRHQNSKDFMGSTVCLRAEVYGCEFQTDCLTIGSEVFARWNSVKQHTRYFHGFITKVRETSVEVSPSGEHGAKVNEIVERPRAKQFYVIIDKKSKAAEIKLGSEVIVASKDNFGFSQGKVTQKFVTWYGVQLGNGEKVWSKAHDIRLLRTPVYCGRE